MTKKYVVSINSKRDFQQFIHSVKSDYELCKEWERTLFNAFYTLQAVYGDKPAANLVRAYVNSDAWEYLSDIANGEVPYIESPENYC